MQASYSISKRFKISLLLIVYIGIALTCSGQCKRAIVIGLGEYQDKSWGRIHGDRDVGIIKNLLINSGYSDITTLVNKNATKSAIISSIISLTQRSSRGDVIYLHFSGHGQQITDLNGDEEDGFDEAWIPYDANFAYSNSYKGEKHLIDDEIGSLLTKLKTKIGSSGIILVVVDACHSEDSSRNKDFELDYIRGTCDNFVIPLKKRPARINKITENWLTLTACRDFQNNCEMRSPKGEYYGVLSYSLCEATSKITSISNNDAKTFLQNIVDSHRKRGHQTITLTGLTNSISLSSFFK